MASGQFGYSTTLLKYCEYSSSAFNITYIGWDYNLPKIEIEGVNVKYISRKSHLIIRNLRLLYAFHKEIKEGYDIVFTTYYRGISIVRLANPKAKMAIFIDTLGVMLSRTKRNIYDSVLMQELRFFENIAVISEGLAKKMKLRKYEILPIGGECFSKNSKSFDKLNLIYVGTLDNRNMIDCVKGFHLYLKGLKQQDKDAVFTIIGDGPNNELDEIQEYVRYNKLEQNIKLTGYLPQHKLASYFEQANGGISYVPLNQYYEYQPATKTYEYLISGLPTIATATYENKKLLIPEAGVLIEDTADSFSKGILKFQGQKFDSEYIRKRYSQYTWEKVVKDKFIPLIEQCVKK